MQWKTVLVDRERRFALLQDEASGRTFVSIPVENSMTQYDEYYEVDAPTFAGFQADPASAEGFLQQARARQLDHLRLLPPGSDRGEPV